MEAQKKPMFFKDDHFYDADPAIAEILAKEKKRQQEGIVLIASENYTSRGVLELAGSLFHNKYAEGYPGARYYGGTQFVDEVENLAIERTLKAFGLSAEEWGVNVQPLSGSPANFEVYTAMIGPGGKIMGLYLPDGGHLTHGFEREDKKISATSVYFQSKPYYVIEETGLIDYDRLEKDAEEFKPNLIIAGHSAYAQELDYKRFKDIANKVGAKLLCDVAHIVGLIATGEAASPFEFADVVTYTTHKILRGPRGGVIVFRKEYEKDINFAVFPMHQGGPHMNSVAALAYQMREVCSEEYRAYAKQVRANANKIAECLIARGYKVATGSTVNHLLLWDLRPLGLTGSKMEKVLEAINIYLNKNSIAGDKSAMTPGAVRIGTPAVTTRGMKEPEMELIVDIMARAVKVALDVQEKTGKKVVDFLKGLEGNEEIAKLNTEVLALTAQFDIPGALY